MSTNTKLVYFPKPSMVIYRFLDVIKPRTQLAHEYINHVEENLYVFLKEYWNIEELKELVNQLRIESYFDSCNNQDAPVIFRDTQSTFAIQVSITNLLKFVFLTKFGNRIQLSFTCCGNVTNSRNTSMWVMTVLH